MKIDLLDLKENRRGLLEVLDGKIEEGNLCKYFIISRIKEIDFYSNYIYLSHSFGS